MKSFGTAGIRGIFNIDQTLEQVYNVVLASAFVSGKGSYGIGWDGRDSSAVLARVAAGAVCASGNDAIMFGLVPTPVTAYGARESGCKVGFSVTASHNPPEYSGIKLFGERGMELAKHDEARIERALVVGTRMESEDIRLTKEGSVLSSYLDSMLSRFERPVNGLKIAIDCSNGPGAFVTPVVLDALGHRVIALNAQISSRFPARLPEPTAHNLSDTASIVASLGVDFGFAHDGDADRLVMIDSSGRVLPDSVVSIMAMRAVSKERGTIILSENTSSAVEEEAIRLNMRVVRGRIGKTFAEIDKEGAVLATEPSKVVNPEWGMWEDGMYTATLIADAIARDRSLLRLLVAAPKWHYRQLNIPVRVDFRRLVDSATDELERFGISETRQLDGLKILFNDRSWIMFRASGTEAKTRIYCESLDQVRLEELLQAGRTMVGEFTVRQN